MQRSRAARATESSRKVDYLRDEVALRLVDRLLFIKRGFGHVLDYGSGSGHFAKALQNLKDEDKHLLRSRISCLTMGDSSKEVLHRDNDHSELLDIKKLVFDEENLPFEQNTFGAIVSNLSMHWINDLPGALIQIQRCLLPDAPFIGSILGGDTLFELRTSLQLAENERRGGISPRVSPMTDVRDLGNLLQRASLKLPTIDADDVVVDYPDLFALMRDLQYMGESNAVISRLQTIPRDVLVAASSIYKTLYGNEDGSIPATFRVLYMIGWKESESTPAAPRRGSGQKSLADVL